MRDLYALLSPFWHGMAPDEKKLAVSIVESHDHSFTVACVKELIAKAHVPMAEMQNLRVAIELALEDPSHLERGRPERAQVEQPAEVRAAQAKVASATSGLRTFELHPKAADGSPLLSGHALFDHLVKMARRSVSTGNDLKPSAALDVEYSEQQQRIINPRAVDYAMHEIAKHAHGTGAQQSLATRKLDNLGYIRADCGLANNPDRIRRLQNQLGLTQSLAAINKYAAHACPCTLTCAPAPPPAAPIYPSHPRPLRPHLSYTHLCHPHLSPGRRPTPTRPGRLWPPQR